jgi:hypothetical protein
MSYNDQKLFMVVGTKIASAFTSNRTITTVNDRNQASSLEQKLANPSSQNQIKQELVMKHHRTKLTRSAGHLSVAAATVR